MGEISDYKSVLDLAYELRRVQRRYNLDVIAGTRVVGDDVLTLRFSGVQTPICEIENEDGAVYHFSFADLT